MKAKYKHTNIVAKDWQALSRFYQDVFGCTVIPPERDLKGQWLDSGTGVSNAHVKGVHLLLPGRPFSLLGAVARKAFNYRRENRSGPS